ncbi:hypothetical protein KL920_005432 [Ogataea angusta]|nr:hypothetical protein KL920_005432 [Ogataea angusta]
MLESSINPAMVMITGQYYKADEHHGQVRGFILEPWRLNLFIIGAVSMVIGIAFVLYVPDDPSKAWFLDDEEKARLVERLRGNQQGFGSKQIKMHQIKEALTDVVTWYYFWYGVSSDIPSGSMGSFGSILLNDDFEFSVSKSMLMNLPSGAIGFLGNPLFVWSCQKVWNSRMFISVFHCDLWAWQGFIFRN